jgi:hypothetical protein
MMEDIMNIKPDDLRRWVNQKWGDEPVHLDIPAIKNHECMHCRNSFPAHKGTLSGGVFICDICI